MIRVNRREALGAAVAAAAAASSLERVHAAPSTSGIRWLSTRQNAPWRSLSGIKVGAVPANVLDYDMVVRTDRLAQTIEGIGGAFGERSWDALEALPEVQREQVLQLLFGSEGAGFTLCRTPIGANDISRRWYSYDETDDDFDLRDFSVVNDQQTLIPFIRAAMRHRPDLRLWASPWSPPTWMKTNRFYAMAPAKPFIRPNGIRPDQVGREGADYFIQEPRFFNAYARYFARYIEAYRAAGIAIDTVMPQNEFNSAQPFPSCCWTPEGLARFIPYLGKAMDQVGVRLFFGTLERADPELLFKVLEDSAAAAHIKGVGVQWAGKGALARIHERYPDLTIWGSEQECGVGTNDWHYARYSWSLMKRYFANGARAYQYWNMVMPTGGMSGWGWPQNSLVSIDTGRRTFHLNHEYYLMRHLSAFVKPGARYMPIESFVGFENQIGFRTPDGSLILILQNDMTEPLRIRARIGERLITAELPADSFNTIVLPVGWDA